MKICGVTLENFMLFDKLDAEFSPNVNIICGENSTGKTALIKLLYACAKCLSDIWAWDNKITQEPEEVQDYYSAIRGSTLANKIAPIFGLNSGIFLPALIKLPSKNQFHIVLDFGLEEPLDYIFEKPFLQTLNKEIPLSKPASLAYIPPKEMMLQFSHSL